MVLPGGVVPIPLDWLPSQLHNSEERLLSVVGQMARGLNLPEEMMVDTVDNVDGNTPLLPQSHFSDQYSLISPRIFSLTVVHAF